MRDVWGDLRRTHVMGKTATLDVDRLADDDRRNGIFHGSHRALSAADDQKAAIRTYGVTPSTPFAD